MAEGPGRPNIKPALTPTDRMVELSGWIGFVVLVIYSVIAYITMPDSIPLHFSMAWEADRYGDKSTIFLLTGLGVMLFLGLTWLNHYPRIFNYPVAITPENAPFQYSNATRMMRWFKLIIVLLFNTVLLIIDRTAHGMRPQYAIWIVWILVFVILVSPVWTIVNAFRKK